jgi:hypothetical protein
MTVPLRELDNNLRYLRARFWLDHIPKEIRFDFGIPDINGWRLIAGQDGPLSPGYGTLTVFGGEVYQVSKDRFFQPTKSHWTKMSNAYFLTKVWDGQGHNWKLCQSRPYSYKYNRSWQFSQWKSMNCVNLPTSWEYFIVPEKIKLELKLGEKVRRLEVEGNKLADLQGNETHECKSGVTEYVFALASPLSDKIVVYDKKSWWKKVELGCISSFFKIPVRLS